MSALDDWKGRFGLDYCLRNQLSREAADLRVPLWRDIYAHIERPCEMVLEVGANQGANLVALGHPDFPHIVDRFAVEPNAEARKVLDGICGPSRVFDTTAADIPLPDDWVDLAFTYGVLIHIPPDDLLAACTEIHRVARHYIACIEYFAAEPEEKPYRGKAGRLWKRDFGAFWLDHFPDLVPLASGFAWQRTTGLDNVTWWLFRKPY